LLDCLLILDFELKMKLWLENMMRNHTYQAHAEKMDEWIVWEAEEEGG
jgi:hypothetical protein